MSILKKILNVFGRNASPGVGPLRNRVGGYAWIKPFGHGFGANELAGRAVKTVELLPSGMWRIEPMQSFVVQGDGPIYFKRIGQFFSPGEVMYVCGLVDAVLEPWKEDGVSDSEVSDLYQPKPERTTA